MGKGWTIVAAKFAGKIDRRRLGALAVLILESVLVSVLLSSYNYGYSPRNSTAGKISATAAADPGATESDWFAAVPVLEKTDRVIYPYSVIPGGVRNSAELRNAVAHDDTVAQHYADFNLRNARVMQLRETRAVFVSYRIGSRIFWTKNRLNLPAGETVVTDGEHMVRARCGNRLSDVPIGPVLANEPLPEAMEIPADGGLLAAPESLSELPLAVPPTTAIVVPPLVPASIYIPIVPPLFPIGGTTSSPGIPSGPLSPPPPPSGPPAGPPPPPPPATPPPISTPEPSDFWMLTTGCACVWLMLRRKVRA
ncbi:MAG: hypothetical protein WCC97_10150 [Candidatus Acidiferrales bacterium]